MGCNVPRQKQISTYEEYFHYTDIISPTDISFVIVVMLSENLHKIYLLVKIV